MSTKAIQFSDTSKAYVAIAFLSFKMYLPAFRIYLRLRRRTYFMFLQSCVSSQTKKTVSRTQVFAHHNQILPLLIGIKGGPRTGTAMDTWLPL